MQTATPQKLVLRTARGDIVALDVTDATQTHKQDQRLPVDDLGKNTPVRAHVEQRGGHEYATEVEVLSGD